MKIRGTSPLSSLGGCWPNPEQELLLQAALFQGERSINAWHLWKTTTKIETRPIDLCSFQLLPLLYQKLKLQGVEDPLVEKFKGVYRLNWYKNQRLFHMMVGLLQFFHQANIKTMILKGAALSFLYYRDHGLRTMADADVLVPTKKVFEAIKMLGCLGWTPKPMPSGGFTDGFLTIRHSQAFQNGAGQEFDLHWHVLLDCCQTGADEDFWEGATEVKIHNVPTFALNPTDQLFHICVHGATWCWIPHLRWISDAMIIIQNLPSEIDWGRLIMQARKRQLVLRLKKTLSYLRDKFDALIPHKVLKDLLDTPVPKREYLEYKYYITQPPTFLSNLVKFWFSNARLTKDAGLLVRIVQFPKYLQYTWGISSFWKVPFYAIFRGMRKLWRTTVWHVNRVDDGLRR
jgi:hypothetical protein